MKSRKNKELSISGIISKRRADVLLRKGCLGLLFRVILVAAVGYVLFTQVFIITQAHGYDMFPSIRDGDLVIAFRLQRKYSKGDVVLCGIEGKSSVRRVLAKETDIVTIGDQGTVLVNGTCQSEDIMYPTYEKEGIEYPFTVPDGTVFVLGDYRTQTTDSRDVGPILSEDIYGKVITILRRRGL